MSFGNFHRTVLLDSHSLSLWTYLLLDFDLFDSFVNDFLYKLVSLFLIEIFIVNRSLVRLDYIWLLWAGSILKGVVLIFNARILLHFFVLSDCIFHWNKSLRGRTLILVKVVRLVSIIEVNLKLLEELSSLLLISANLLHLCPHLLNREVQEVLSCFQVKLLSHVWHSWVHLNSSQVWVLFQSLAHHIEVSWLLRQLLLLIVLPYRRLICANYKVKVEMSSGFFSL